MKVLYLSRYKPFNKSCLLRSAPQNCCRGESENYVQNPAFYTPNRWINSRFQRKVRTLICPPNAEVDFSRAPLIGRFRAFVFYLRNPNFKLWEHINGCKQVTPFVSDLVSCGNYNKLQNMVDNELLESLKLGIEQNPWVKTIELGEPHTRLCFWHSFWETNNEETGSKRIAVETALYTNWVEPSVIAVAQHFVFQRYLSGGDNQDWVVTDLHMMRMDK
uniref:Uncharacterized protein LOC111101389 n=1 Tax=Crassostrea virginica TaxID=6565 RepID=A0A8B8AGC1_CRAVI|nr:uncharacterized protein LOC111101389 [Crassostrea virginica]